jgi:hypothetical protein
MKAEMLDLLQQGHAGTVHTKFLAQSCLVVRHYNDKDSLIKECIPANQ